MKSEFLNKMKDMLGDEYDSYLASIDGEAKKGFRINTLKVDPDTFFHEFDIEHEKSPFAINGYYTPKKSGIGFTPEYLMGLFYMQEPSASSAVTILKPEKGMRVVDLCASPGSKSTQISEYLGNDGLLLANEFVSKRSGILCENIERHGASNVIVTNSDTKDIANNFPNFFDMVLCDAPCSGEGMFRKSDEAIEDWSQNNVLMCAKRQREILHNAYKCLKPGGYMVYSTCTFSKEENEDNMDWFIETYPDMEIVEPNVNFGRHAYLSKHHSEKAIRIFPMDGGEGHFICLLHKQENEYKLCKVSEIKGETISKEIHNELKKILVKEYPYYLLKNGKLYGGVNPFYDTGKARLVRHQVYLGEIKNKRFEPSYHMFMSTYSDFVNKVDLDEESLNKYLHGEQLNIGCAKGYVALTYHNHVIGHGKSDGKVIKNKFPKHLRRR